MHYITLDYQTKKMDVVCNTCFTPSSSIRSCDLWTWPMWSHDCHVIVLETPYSLSNNLNNFTTSSMVLTDTNSLNFSAAIIIVNLIYCNTLWYYVSCSASLSTIQSHEHFMQIICTKGTT